ncbi:uncharacterized protein LOC115996041 [Ipomoea triloba]|uniref:uncharacterized protein LOC115996041 n=1 Tax=Ipomoea triloba TaxID=35885 RepID=UPI00125DFF58|nr:uncharacterized protein LOC115996041 [Ipomoea triloba]
MGFSSILVETDSEAVVKAIFQEQTYPQLVETLIVDCKFLIRQVPNSKLLHTFREGNQCADFLANLGQSSPWSTTILNTPLEGMTTLLVRDANKVAFNRLR